MISRGWEVSKLSAFPLGHFAVELDENMEFRQEYIRQAWSSEGLLGRLPNLSNPPVRVESVTSERSQAQEQASNRVCMTGSKILLYSFNIVSSKLPA